eukprot:5026116-Amphidinium_carterae.1
MLYPCTEDIEATMRAILLQQRETLAMAADTSHRLFELAEAISISDEPVGSPEQAPQEAIVAAVSLSDETAGSPDSEASARLARREDPDSRTEDSEHREGPGWQQAKQQLALQRRPADQAPSGTLISLRSTGPSC